MAWCDAMGTARNLTRSFHTAADSIFKLQSAFSIAQQEVATMRCYPMMDGVYVTCPSRDAMVTVLQIALGELAMEFIGSTGTEIKYMMRGGLAFGPTLHGVDIGEHAFYGKARNGKTVTRGAFVASPLSKSRSQVLVSPAMVQAYNAEKKAPPFGIYVDDSAKLFPQMFGTTGFKSNLHQWWQGSTPSLKIAAHLYEQIEFYLSKAETHAVGMGYDLESINRHRRLAFEYFGGLKKK